MTRDGTCGVFISEMVVFGREVAGPIGRRVTGQGGAGGCTTGSGGWRWYK